MNQGAEELAAQAAGTGMAFYELPTSEYRLCQRVRKEGKGYVAEFVLQRQVTVRTVLPPDVHGVHKTESVSFAWRDVPTHYEQGELKADLYDAGSVKGPKD